MGVDPATDMRPRLVVSAAYGTVNTSWSAWLAGEGGGDLRALVNQAFDLLQSGLAAL
jgi:hypothetical protein